MNNKEKLSRFTSYMLAMLFPPICPVCDKATGSLIEGELCENCRRLLESEFVSVCPHCRLSPQNCRCAPDVAGGDSDRSPFTKVSQLIFSGYYTGYSEDSVISRLVYKMKRDFRSSSGTVFARMTASTLSRFFVENRFSPADFTVTHIPRSKSSLRKYGFDHMELVSRRIAKMLGCAFVPLIIRKGGTDQKKLRSDERAKNAVTSIYSNPRKISKIKNAKIILIDDIITTGSTMRAAVSRLSLSGANMIIPVAIMISKTIKKPSIDGKN